MGIEAGIDLVGTGQAETYLVGKAPVGQEYSTHLNPDPEQAGFVKVHNPSLGTYPTQPKPFLERQPAVDSLRQQTSQA